MFLLFSLFADHQTPVPLFECQCHRIVGLHKDLGRLVAIDMFTVALRNVTSFKSPLISP